MEGKVVMVTGASAGLGRELCLHLAAAGCRIVAAARRTDRLETLCNEINSGSGLQGVQALAIELDVQADSRTIEESVRKAWDSFGTIDALVNNAGIRGGIHSSLEWPEEEWTRIMKTNQTGLWLVSKHVCKLMSDAKVKGSVVNISSVLGIERGKLPGGLAYVASKAGVDIITKVMAVELGKMNIRVNSIAPGLFKSEITEGLMKKDWLNNVAERTIPLRTHGTSDPALTSLVSYLINDAMSQYVTGNVFVVDAGATLPGIPIFSSL